MPKKLKKSSPVLPQKQQSQQPVTPVDDLALSASEDAAVRERYQQFVAAKSAFADLAFQIAVLETRRADLLNKINDANTALMLVIREGAKARGVDPDAQAAEGKPALTFDLTTFKFHRSVKP